VATPSAVVTDWAREVATTRGVRIVLTAGASTPGSTLVALGADHGGFALKEEVKRHLTRLGYRFHDFGTHSTEAVDYPDVARKVARAIRSGEARLGILVDGAGLGSAMAANKVRGIRAAPCTDSRAARNAREHNDANVLTLGSGFLDVARMQEIVEVFLTASCTEERHRRRVDKIVAIEAEESR
jgi:ribose 5-phosphate isomerase B